MDLALFAERTRDFSVSRFEGLAGTIGKKRGGMSNRRAHAGEQPEEADNEIDGFWV